MKIIKKGILKNPITSKQLIENVTNTVTKLSIDCVNHAKEVISDNSVDTGEFVNSIWSEVKVNKKQIGFTMYDGVKYGIYHEKGTKLHFVSFYKNNNVSEPILADWGHRVLGLSQEEMLKMKGMPVKINATMPFLKSILYIQGITEEEFIKYEMEFKKRVKKGNY